MFFVCCAFTRVNLAGDIHGSFRDLVYFSRALWSLGVDFTPSKYLFLGNLSRFDFTLTDLMDFISGDYVDRGPHQVETIAYLLALKVLYPNQVFLLRGNHEFHDQNAAYDPNTKVCRQFLL